MKKRNKTSSMFSPPVTDCGMRNRAKVKGNMFVLCVLLIIFSVSHAESIYALDVDFFDNWGFGGGVPISIGSPFDRISWEETDCPLGIPDDQWMTLGVINSIQDVTAYCVNTDRELDTDYDVCIIKNSSEAIECQLTGVTFPAVTFNASSIATDWAEADNVLQLFSSPVCDNENGNTYTKSTQGIKRGQIRYYGITDKGAKVVDTGITSTTGRGIHSGSYSTKKLETTKNVLRKIEIHLDWSGSFTPNDNLNVSIKKDFDGSLIETISTAYTSLNKDALNTFDFTDIYIGDGNYYIDLRSNTNPSANDFHWDSCFGSGGDCLCTTLYRSTDSGSSWIDDNCTGRFLNLIEYADDGCGSKGTTSNSPSYDYYFVDEMFTDCVTDGASFYDIRGFYSGTSNIFIDAILCSADEQCDTDHDDTRSTNPTVLPSDPCKTRVGFECSVASDCWNDNSCGGSGIKYDSTCDGFLTDIDKNTYVDGCGDIGVLDSVSVEKSNGNCTVDGGFPPNYVCDSLFDGIEYDSVGQLYNNVCKGWVGVGCSTDNDCHSLLKCESNFCGLSATAIYTHSPDTNNINKSNTIIFDNSLSISSDFNIQFSCWNINGQNLECDGNSTQCGTSCVNASFDSASWDNGYTRLFSSGGNFNVKLTVGSEGLYEDDYQESFCVSGDGTSCFSCFDNQKNDDETSVDWGGRCGFPYFIRCNNNVLDNITNETSIDYGGDCGNCENTSIDEDLNLNLLIESGIIIYPFNDEQCEDGDAVQGGAVFFVVLLTTIIAIPLIMILIILVILFLFFGTGTLALIGSLFGGNNRNIPNNTKNIPKNKK